MRCPVPTAVSPPPPDQDLEPLMEAADGRQPSRELSLDGHEDGDSSSDEERTWTRRSPLLFAVPLALLGALLLVAAPALAPALAPDVGHLRKAPQAPRVTARQLMESEGFARAMADNAMALGQGHVREEHRPALEAAVSRELRAIAADLWRRYPDSGALLDGLPMSEEEQQAFLKLMRSVSDHRVRRLGHEAVLALHRSVAFTRPGPELRTSFLDLLAPKVAEIRQLRDEVIPEAIRGNDGADDSALTIDTEGLHFFKQFHHWHLEVDVLDPAAGRAPEPRRLFDLFGTTGASTGAAAGGSQSAGTELVDGTVQALRMKEQMEIYTEQLQEWAATKFNIHIPDMNEATRGIETTAALQCGMEAAMTMDLRKIFECGVQFWSVGMDIMKNVISGIGPVTTSTQQTKFASFDDLMN